MRCEKRPLRPVIGSIRRAGRGSVLGPDTNRRAHWWELTLVCGHIVERTTKGRRARCDYCPPGADDVDVDGFVRPYHRHTSDGVEHAHPRGDEPHVHHTTTAPVPNEE